MEGELRGRVSLILCFVEAFFELSDLDDVWVNVSVAPKHMHISFFFFISLPLTLHTMLGQIYFLRARAIF